MPLYTTAYGTEETPHLRAVPASNYSYEELADIYNQTRVDYIVPMPMNAKRMREYVAWYDVDLDDSVVSLNSNNEVTGLCMIGFREARAWITRLGVIPERRQRKNGQFLMETVLTHALERGVRHVQLEVIKGNEPAYNLFLKLGFKTVRELMIIRRPPGAPTTEVPQVVVTPIADDDIPGYLAQREDRPAWLEETTSLLNAGSLAGLWVGLPTGETGWVVYQRTPFQLTHFVLSPCASPRITLALLYHVHIQNPMQDTKIENLPVNTPCWPAFRLFGYLEVFRRVEMALVL
jgi:ribosomal protein S18 acetylase RimI-like enzyme